MCLHEAETPVSHQEGNQAAPASTAPLQRRPVQLTASVQGLNSPPVPPEPRAAGGTSKRNQNGHHGAETPPLTRHMQQPGTCTVGTTTTTPHATASSSRGLTTPPLTKRHWPRPLSSRSRDEGESLYTTETKHTKNQSTKLNCHRTHSPQAEARTYRLSLNTVLSC